MGPMHDPRDAPPAGLPARDAVTPAWLLNQGIAGNEEQFARLFLPLVQGWAQQEVRRVGRGGRLDPGDFAQDVLLKVFARFRAEPFTATTGPGGFRAFLHCCVRHAVVDALRSADAAYRGTGLSPERWEEVEQDIDSLADRFDTAWEKNQAKVREAVARVRQRVGAVRWEAFRQSVVEGCKGAEVAARLGLTPSQVYDARHDIKAYLRKELADAGYEE